MTSSHKPITEGLRSLNFSDKILADDQLLQFSNKLIPVPPEIVGLDINEAAIKMYGTPDRVLHIYRLHHPTRVCMTKTKVKLGIDQIT